MSYFTHQSNMGVHFYTRIGVLSCHSLSECLTAQIRALLALTTM